MKHWSAAVVVLALGSLVGTVATRSVLQGQQGTPAVELKAPAEPTSYRDVVKQVLPAVVSIEARAKVVQPVKGARQRAVPPGMEQQLPPEFRKFFEGFDIPEVPDQTPERSGFGSGFLISDDGTILTNNHVVAGAESVEVELKDGRKFVSKDIKIDPKTDLAVVKIEAKEKLPYLQFADSDRAEIGDRVLAVGAPFGLTGSVSHGIVSGKGRSLKMNMYEDFLQTDAAINPGNSGGPLVDMQGRVIGINTAIKSRSGGWQGVGLAISSNMARSVADQLRKNGVVRRGYLGVQVQDLSDRALAGRLGVPEGEFGVLVSSVFEDTPAAKAGLKEGDVVTRLDGKPVRDGKELQRVVAALPLNSPVRVDLVRDGKAQTAEVTIEEQPETFGSARAPAARPSEKASDAVKVDKLGIEAADLNADLAEKLGFGADQTGPVVTQVDPEGLAAAAGLRRGALIARVDRQPVASVAELKAAVERASLEKGVLLQVRSAQGGTSFVLVRQAAK